MRANTVMHQSPTCLSCRIPAASARAAGLGKCRRQLGFLQGRVDEAFFEPLPGEELESWGRDAAARHARFALGHAGGPDALARAAQCPGGQRQQAPRQLLGDQGFLDTYERRKVLFPQARAVRPRRLVTTELGIHLPHTCRSR
jgi:hypothetical protein